MKKRDSKALHQLSLLLPPSYEIRNHTMRMRLYELYQAKDNGQKGLDNLPALTEDNRDDLLSITVPALEMYNHHRRLKAAYLSGGTKGVQAYIKWVKMYNDKFEEQNAGMVESKPMNEKLYELATGAASSFWKSLIAFLISFATIFSSSKTSDNE